jgi:hypothetical protein
MSPTCRDMSATTQRVAPILARWVRVADTKFKMSWQFVSARANILLNFRNSCVEIYYMVLEYIRTDTVMFSILSCSPHETKKYHNTPQHNRKHNCAPCPTAPSAHASYKGYGCNNTKPPRPPHRNTMIDVVVLGCGSIRTGEGAAAPFIGVHILGEIRPAGGFVTLAESRWEDQIGPSIMVQKLNHTTINRRGLLMFGESARGRNGGPVCGDGN